jgi:hypothetical protein
MAETVHALAERLFAGFLAPLVVGGTMTPGHPIGGEAAFSLAESDHPSADIDLRAHVDLARVRRARSLVPIDRFDGIDGASWVLAAALHDLVLTAHPELAKTFQSDNPQKLLTIVLATLDKIPPTQTPGEALARHTLFARMLEISRTDRAISWWTGKALFLGEEVPARLTAWPEFRKVQIDEQHHPLVTLPAHGGRVDPLGFREAVGRFLGRTPLTDFAYLHRDAGDDSLFPPFSLTASHLALLGTRAGRTLALRAECTGNVDRSLGPQNSLGTADRALGRAVRLLAHGGGGWGRATAPIAYLGERVLRRAQQELASASDPKPLVLPSDPEAIVALTWGAAWAQLEIALHGESFSALERRGLLALIAPLASHGAASDVKARLEASLAS